MKLFPLHLDESQVLDPIIVEDSTSGGSGLWRSRVRMSPRVWVGCFSEQTPKEVLTFQTPRPTVSGSPSKGRDKTNKDISTTLVE